MVSQGIQHTKNYSWFKKANDLVSIKIQSRQTNREKIEMSHYRKVNIVCTFPRDWRWGAEGWGWGMEGLLIFSKSAKGDGGGCNILILRWGTNSKRVRVFKEGLVFSGEGRGGRGWSYSWSGDGFKFEAFKLNQRVWYVRKASFLDSFFFLWLQK